MALPHHYLYSTDLADRLQKNVTYVKNIELRVGNGIHVNFSRGGKDSNAAADRVSLPLSFVITCPQAEINICF